MQVDPTGRGDKGCDGWVDDLMLACYGAIREDPDDLAGKIRGDFNKACKYWRDEMRSWAFVHNNKRGLAEGAMREITHLRRNKSDHGVEVLAWPPDLLWDETGGQLSKQQLMIIIGAPPSDDPASMTYIGRCVQALARLPIPDESGQVPEVDFGKVEENEFSDSVSTLLIESMKFTDLISRYFVRSPPGEQAQAAENIKLRYDRHRARNFDSDLTFHALCEDLRHEAFGNIVDASTEELRDQRSACLMVVTHFFEKCTIFEPAKAGRK